MRRSLIGGRNHDNRKTHVSADRHDTASIPIPSRSRWRCPGGGGNSPVARADAPVGAGGLTTAAADVSSADPIYAAIEQHKQTAAIYDAAAAQRAGFEDLDMNTEQAKQCGLLDEALEVAWVPCEQAGIDLITTEPTTLAGITAAIQYIRIQTRNNGTFMPYHIKFEWDRGYEADGRETLGWLATFLDTIASATAALGNLEVPS